jgi:hypothetical protein
MTNKKLKLAAMSVALTACVAAQPLVAHAVDAPADPEGKDADPKAALEEGADLKGQEENAPEGKDQVEAPVNQEADKKEQEPAFAPDTESKDVEIDYKDPQPDPKDPDTTITEGDVIDTSKKDEESGETGKIGKATKTETVDPDASTTEVEMGKTTTHPDGSTTTPGTQITTDQGTGEAKAETETETQEKGDKEKDPEKGQIDLNEELGDARKDLTWDGVEAEAGKDQEEKAKFNGYTIQESKPSADGNSKELTLKKTETGKEKHLSAEDIAKLMDESEHLDKKEDGSYTLKKTEDILDEEGKVIGTRTTVYEVTRDSVQTITETTLKIRMDKGTKPDEKDLNTEIEQPDIKDEKTQEVILPSTELENILKDPTTVKKDDGTYIYTETIPNEDGTTTIREYTITKTDEARDLTPEELAKRLAGDTDYEYKNGKFYYKGVEMDDLQINAVRHTLRYEVKVQETHKTPGQVSGKDEAETTAKTEAIKNALREAAKKYDITLTEDELKGIKLTGGDLVVTRDGKKYTFHYTTKAGVEYSAPIDTGETTVDGKDAEDVKETTVTGTAYVTKGTISWSKDGQTGTYTASGIIKDGEHAAEKPEIPEGAVESTNANGDTVYTVTTHNPDGSTTETIYTFKTEKDVTLTDKQKEDAAWEALAKAEHKSVEELQKEGYKIDSSTFTDITKTSWTVETKTSTTETTKETLNQTLVDDTWTLTGTTLKTKDGQIYKNLKKNPDGTYTATKEDGDKTITYTFTLGEEKDLDEPTIKAMLAAKFPESNGQITLDTTAKTATYKVGETTVTIDYRSLSKKTLKIDKSVSEAVSVTDTIKTDQDLKDAQERLYQELKKKVDAITLQPGEELWIGDLQIKDIDSQKEEIIKHFTTAVSHENMSQQALIAALNAQADEAKTTKVTVNEGTKYQEELKNYYSGDENLKHNPKDPPTHWNGKPKKLEQRDDITHLDLASGAKMNKLPDQNGNVTTTDCVLLAKGQKLEWNYDANNLVKGQGNTEVGLEKHISKDTEDGEGYHYEYDRLDGKNKNPNKSAFYKLTGTVAYDAVKDKKTGKVKTYYDYGSALEAYLEATGKTRRDFSDDEWAAIYGTYVVPITSPGTFVDYTTYQVYTKTAEMTSYGYMTRDANTCVNSTFGRQYDSWDNPEHYKNWDYIGGYDLMISDLVQVSEGKVVGQTQSSIKTLWAPLAIRSTQSLENKSLQLDAKHTSTPKTETENLGSGYEEKGTFTYNVSYKHTDNYNNHCSQGVQGTGTGKYKTFTQLLKEKFSGKGETSYDTGKVSYTYRTTENVDTTALTKDTKNTTTAKATYNFTTVARKNFTVTTPADPEEPTPPQEEEVETPDEVVTPETPELPPVQDATPDDAAPETPVLPSDAVLPAVQDALPQTGVNWMAALGMAFSGMLLTIAGAFASLKYKEKH